MFSSKHTVHAFNCNYYAIHIGELIQDNSCLTTKFFFSESYMYFKENKYYMDDVWHVVELVTSYSAQKINVCVQQIQILIMIACTNN